MAGEVGETGETTWRMGDPNGWISGYYLPSIIPWEPVENGGQSWKMCGLYISKWAIFFTEPGGYGRKGSSSI